MTAIERGIGGGRQRGVLLRAFAAEDTLSLSLLSGRLRDHDGAIEVISPHHERARPQ